MAAGTAQRASRPTAGARDATALKAAELEKARDDRDARTAAAQVEAQAENARVNARAVDYSGVDTPLAEETPDTNPDAPLPEFVEFRAKMTLDEMTYGRKIVVPAQYPDENNPSHYIPAVLGDVSKYNFKEGRRYKVPREMYEHLDRIGAVWH
jgi:hypothetical protein